MGIMISVVCVCVCDDRDSSPHDFQRLSALLNLVFRVALAAAIVLLNKWNARPFFPCWSQLKPTHWIRSELYWFVWLLQVTMSVSVTVCVLRNTQGAINVPSYAAHLAPPGSNQCSLIITYNQSHQVGSDGDWSASVVRPLLLLTLMHWLSMSDCLLLNKDIWKWPDQ